MAQINLKDIVNPVHRRLMQDYGSNMNSTPLKTRFHKIPLLVEDQEAIDPKYDLTPLLLDELIYRIYTKNAISILIYGDRRDYKSTTVLQLWLWWQQLLNSAKIFPKLTPDYENIVDNDITLLEKYMKAPLFTPFIKDEFDTNISGIGNMTTSQTLINVIKRSAYYQKPIFVCSPVWKAYPVDYFLQTWEYRRYGKKEVMCIIYDKNSNPKGHVYIPMPSDEEIEKYDNRKKSFMGNMDRMHFTIEEELDAIAEKIIHDPVCHDFDFKKKSDRVGFMSWCFKKFPILQSKTLQENIFQRVKFLMDHELLRMP